MVLSSDAPNLFYSFAMQVIVVALAVAVGVGVYRILGRTTKPRK